MNTEKKGVAPASPFSYATKQPGGDKTHRPPDTAARLRPTKQPVYFTTEQPGGDSWYYHIMAFCQKIQIKKTIKSAFCYKRNPLPISRIDAAIRSNF